VIVGDLATALDPVRLAVAAGLEPDPWQAAVLRSAASRQALLCCRQSGKSTTTAVLGVHTALHEPGSLVPLVSPSLRQSGELFRKCLQLYRAAGRPVPSEAETLRLELENGSRIVSLPGKDSTIRGYSAVRLLAVDEAARVPDDVYASVRPMLAVSQGRLVALSTPFGRRGFFWREWEDGGAAWDRVKVTAHDCARIPASFLEEERRSLGDARFRSEYLCEFVDTEESVFDSAEVLAALDPGVRPLFPQGLAA
jgi:hypothetical protein